MNARLKATVAIGLMGAVCLSAVAGADLTVICKAPRCEDVTYTVLPLPESMFASGCTGSGGGWPPCPLCPILMATEFTGTLTLTPHIRVPLGHRVYDVTIEDWLVALPYLGDEPTEVTGEGTYDRWTWIDGSSWQSMTLDLYIDGEEVYLFSGVVEDPHLPGGGPYPDIEISLESDTECWGYWLDLDAEHVRTGVVAEGPVTAVENSDAGQTTEPR